MSDSSIEISKTCDKVKEMLLSKNMKYGNSALDPVRVFSKSSAVEQLLVRIDDKISRIQRGAGLIASDEDVIDDLIGYLVLLKIALSEQGKEEPSLSFGNGLYEDVISFYKPTPSANSPDITYDYSQWDGTDIDSPNEFYFNTLRQNCPD